MACWRVLTTRVHKMSALKKYYAAWKTRMGSFESSLGQFKATYTNSEITNMMHGEHLLTAADVTWTGIEEAFAMFRVYHS